VKNKYVILRHLGDMSPRCLKITYTYWDNPINAPLTPNSMLCEWLKRENSTHFFQHWSWGQGGGQRTLKWPKKWKVSLFLHAIVGTMHTMHTNSFSMEYICKLGYHIYTYYILKIINNSWRKDKGNHCRVGDFFKLIYINFSFDFPRSPCFIRYKTLELHSR
jgi:hypothetical protein